ncbi:MAG TPA: 30S ribosomal protein S9 [archaeon]|nr:30S ribosomal protein S9 [archaeon]
MPEEKIETQPTEEKPKRKAPRKITNVVKPAQQKKEKAKQVFESGKRKSAVARGRVEAGNGRILINGRSLNAFPEFQKMMITEPLVLAGPAAANYNFDIFVSGGGVYGQAEAIRQVIAKGLVRFDKNLKKTFLDYDRALLVADVRHNEPHKPSRSSAGPRRHKQRSKR